LVFIIETVLCDVCAGTEETVVIIETDFTLFDLSAGAEEIVEHGA
jgi:hypothetical protein